jgi:hypothetical protein
MTTNSKEYQQAYYTKNKERILKHQREYSRIWCRANPEKNLWLNTQWRAKKLNMEFDLTIEDLTIPSHCPVLGIELIRGSRGKSDNSPSLDRIDNTKGYTKDNICIISNRANIIKNSGTAEEHLKIADYIIKHKEKAS